MAFQISHPVITGNMKSQNRKLAVKVIKGEHREVIRTHEATSGMSS